MRTLDDARNEDGTIYATKTIEDTKKRRRDYTRNEEETLREMETKRYTLRRLGDARDEDETIRATVRNSLAKTRPRDCTNETIRDDEDSAIRDEISFLYYRLLT